MWCWQVALFTDPRPASGLQAREASCRLQKTVSSTLLPATPTPLNTTSQVHPLIAPTSTMMAGLSCMVGYQALLHNNRAVNTAINQSVRGPPGIHQEPRPLGLKLVHGQPNGTHNLFQTLVGQVSYTYLNDQVFITAATPPGYLFAGAKYEGSGGVVIAGQASAAACATTCRALRPLPNFCNFDSTGAGTCTRYATAPTTYSAAASFTSIFFARFNS